MTTLDVATTQHEGFPSLADAIMHAQDLDGITHTAPGADANHVLLVRPAPIGHGYGVALAYYSDAWPEGQRWRVAAFLWQQAPPDWAIPIPPRTFTQQAGPWKGRKNQAAFRQWAAQWEPLHR